MKHIKRILLIILVLAISVGLFVGGNYLFNKGTYDFDKENLAVFDENLSCFYLQQTDRNIIFRVCCEESASFGYTLVDTNGNTVSTKTKKVQNNCYDILPPSEGYLAGERYTLTLPEGVSFEAEDLKEARSLVFCIDKEAVEYYEFSDAVVKVDAVIGEVVDNTLDVNKLNVTAGDIVFGQNEDGEYVVYKVEEISDAGIAIVTDPAIDEIYSDLEVYGEYVWDVDDIVSNPELEIEIVENVKQSTFFNSLVMTAYADEMPRVGDIEIKIKSNSDSNSIEIEITIPLMPGKNGLFGIGELKNQEVSITLCTEIGLSTKCNIQGITDWDVSASIATDFSWKVDISLCEYPEDEWKKDGDLKSLFSETNKFANLIDYQKNVKKITEKLNNLSVDVIGGEIKLFDWKLPIPSIPGLSFGTEIKLFAKFEIAADVTIGQSNETIYTVGICFINGDFDTYSNTYHSGKDATLSLSGKAKLKTGIKLIVKITLINDKIANINLDPQVGLYADLFITVPTSEINEIDRNKFRYGYFESGVYFSANVNATISGFAKKVNFSYELVEKKFPIDWLTFGRKKIAMGLSTNIDSVYAVDQKVSAPDILFEYFDVTDGNTDTETLSINDIIFVADDGIELKVVDGKLILTEAVVSNTVNITAKYVHTDGMTYSTTFSVLIIGDEALDHLAKGRAALYGLDDTEINLEIAYNEFKQALDLGNTDANFYLGLLYDWYGYPETNYDMAATYYKACKDTNDYAKIALGLLHAYGQGVTEDNEKARILFQEAIDNGFVEGYRGFAEMECTEEDYTTALDYFYMSLEGTEQVFTASAMNYIGYLYINGYGVEQDYALALDWLEKGAALGNRSAMNNIGWLYQNGYGVEQDYSLAIEWYEKAAALGNASAMYNIGWLYETEYRDYALAIEWYEKAAALGNASAMTNIGWLYHDGIYVQMDYTLAIEWYEKAAALGNASAMKLLGDAYLEQEEFSLALEWYEKAVALGYEGAAWGAEWIREEMNQ